MERRLLLVLLVKKESACPQDVTRQTIRVVLVTAGSTGGRSTICFDRDVDVLLVVRILVLCAGISIVHACKCVCLRPYVKTVLAADTRLNEADNGELGSTKLQAAAAGSGVVI